MISRGYASLSYLYRAAATIRRKAKPAFVYFLAFRREPDKKPVAEPSSLDDPDAVPSRNRARVVALAVEVRPVAAGTRVADPGMVDAVNEAGPLVFQKGNI
jgi:hypothetical protein